MNPNQKEMIARLIREGRLAKGFTQKELSELSHISIRSIQRIENGELMPRSYTLKTLAGTLDLPFEIFQKENSVPMAVTIERTKNHTAKKIILSIGASTIIILLALAFLAQASGFPETQFEFLNFTTVVVTLITAVLLFIWRK